MNVSFEGSEPLSLLLLSSQTTIEMASPEQKVHSLLLFLAS